MSYSDLSEVKSSKDFYHQDEEYNPHGYIVEKYAGKEIYDKNLDKKIIVEDIYDLQFEDLEREDQILALKFGWAWGVSSHNDPTKAKKLACYLFRPKQYKFWWNPSRFPAYIGAFGSGKSLILCLKGLYYSIMYPGTRGLLMRATYPQLMDTTIATLMKIFSYFGWRSGEHYNHHISRKIVEINVGKTKSEILYRPAKNEGQDIQSAIEDLQSLEIDWAGIDEIVGVEERVFMAVRNRVGRWGKIPKQEHRQLMVSGNPPSEGSWIQKRWYQKKYTDEKPIQDPEEHSVFVSSTYENRRNLPKDYIEALESSPEYWRNTFLLGHLGFIPPDGEPIYKFFNYEMYVSDKRLEYNPKLPILRGWDIGPTAKNKACIVAQLDSRGVLIVLAEYHMLDPGVTKFGRYVQQNCYAEFPEAKDYKDFCDPVAFHASQTDGQSPAALLLEEGIHLIPGEEGFQLRIEAVEKTMTRIIDGVPGMLVDGSRCKMLVNGFTGGYRYRIIDEPNKRFSKEPVKDQFSHIHDALQYLCSRLAFVDQKKRDESQQAARRRNAALLRKRRKYLGNVMGG